MYQSWKSKSQSLPFLDILLKLKVKKEMPAHCKNIKTGSVVNQFSSMTKIYKTGMFKLLMDRLYEIND